MCLFPKKILYRNNHWFPNGQPLFLSVPCGKCIQCQRSYIDDWFVRCYYEWKNSAQTYFYTLTYNEKYVPRYAGRLVFKRRDVQLFIKRLKKHLRKFGVNLKYIVTSEFGELYGRPHYHALFFLDKEVNPYLFYRIVQDCWSMFDVKYQLSDSRGFVKYGDNVGLVDSSAGIRYVTKYVVKDFSHTEENEEFLKKHIANRIIRLFIYIREKYGMHVDTRMEYDEVNRKLLVYRLVKNKRVFLDYDPLEWSSVFIRKFRAKCSTMLPFHTQSTKLGVSAVDDTEHIDFIHKEVLLMTTKGVERFRLPRYYQRLFWYDRLESEITFKKSRFVLNARGKEQALKDIEVGITEYVNEFNSIRMSPCINQEVVDSVNKKLDSVFFPDVASLQHWFAYFDLDVQVLAIYNRVFRGRCCPEKFTKINFTKQSVKNNYTDYVLYFLNVMACVDYGRLYERPKEIIDHFEALQFNFHPFFQIYEHASQIFDVVSRTLQLQKSRKLEEGDREARMLRQALKKLGVETL